MTHTGEGGICTPGSECPNGTTYPIPCMAGFYAPNPQTDACLDCPAGRLNYIQKFVRLRCDHNM